MATLKIIIDDGNAAFEDNPDEMSRILHELADMVRPDIHCKIYDVNGNPVGTMTYQEMTP